MGAAVLIVLDSSALASVLLGEDKATAVARAIDANSPRLLSAASLLEAAMVLESRKGEAGGRELDLLLYRIRVDIVPVDRIRQNSPGSLGGALVRGIILPR